VAPGAVGPTGRTPPQSQAQSSSPAPSGKNKGIEGELKHLFFQMFQPLVVLLLLFVFGTLHYSNIIVRCVSSIADVPNITYPYNWLFTDVLKVLIISTCVVI
jgi:hypothetical protein